MSLHWGFIVLIHFSSIIDSIYKYEFIENASNENYFTNEIFRYENFRNICIIILFHQKIAREFSLQCYNAIMCVSLENVSQSHQKTEIATLLRRFAHDLRHNFFHLPMICNKNWSLLPMI